MVARADGVFTPLVLRRRWRLGRTSQTLLDRAPDELPGMHAALLYVLAKLHAWLGSGVGLHAYAEVPAMRAHGSRRTVQRWLSQIHPCGMRLQQALRTAVIERLEPQPVEVLFPGGLSPPGAVRCRRWKDPAAVYSLATALAFLFKGAVALRIAVPILLVEALRRLDGPILTAAR